MRSYKKGKTNRYRMIRKANRKRKASGFERAIHAILKQEHIPFVKEKTVGRCHVDIAIGDKFLVECQGCHWHLCKKCSPKPSVLQRKAGARDARRFWFFSQLGFKVVEIWECELKNDPDGVRRTLRRLGREARR